MSTISPRAYYCLAELRILQTDSQKFRYSKQFAASHSLPVCWGGRVTGCVGIGGWVSGVCWVEGWLEQRPGLKTISSIAISLR